MSESSPNLVHLLRIHAIIPGFLIWPTFEGQRSKWHRWHVSLLFDLEHSNFVRTCILAPSMFLQNCGLIGLQIWLPGAHLGKPTESYWPETLYVLLGKSNSQTTFRSSLIFGLVTRGPKLKTQKVLWHLTNGWIISKFLCTFHKDTWHYTQVFYLTYFWRSQRSKFKTAPLVGTFRYYFT
jgi:hypothetical protein